MQSETLIQINGALTYNSLVRGRRMKQHNVVEFLIAYSQSIFGQPKN